MEERYFADDRPYDLSRYDGMSDEEIQEEINRLETNARKERDRIRREKALAVV